MKTKLDSQARLSDLAHPQVVEIPQPLEIHPSVSPLAAELLMKTAEVLAHTPEKYNQCDSGAADCGSPCCIIGWMRRFVGKQNIYWRDCVHDYGLTQSQASSIFDRSNWTTPSSYPCTHQEGIARIEHFLRTGE